MTNEELREVDARIARISAVARAINAVLQEHKLSIGDNGALIDDEKVGYTGYHLGNNEEARG